MLISRIRRKSFKLFSLRVWRVWRRGGEILDVWALFRRPLQLGRRACIGREDGVMRFDDIIWRGLD